MIKDKIFHSIFLSIFLACSVAYGNTITRSRFQAGGGGGFFVTRSDNGGNSNVGNNRPGNPGGCQANNTQSPKMEINSLRIHSDIRYRYSTTHVVSVLTNRNAHSKEFTFSVDLPKTAFISSFQMEIDCVVYKSYVRAKGEAQNIYTEARRKGLSAGIVESSSRNANLFTVNITARAQSKLKFYLKYEQLLQRNKIQLYQQTINISPDQVTNIQAFKVTAKIEESKKITMVNVSKFRLEGETEEEFKASKKATIRRPAENLAMIEWSPSTRGQTVFSKQKTNGILNIRYDIEKGDDAGEILVTEDYFVHFFGPSKLKPKRKHVVFILDTSGSMAGRKMTQLQEAQKKILNDLSSEDFFNIITFESSVSMWSPQGSNVQKNFLTLPASTANIGTARTFINALKANGGTNIHSALVDGLNLIQGIKAARNSRMSPTTNNLPENVESLIIFLTDGEPTEGLTDLDGIQKSIQKHNAKISVPIFSLAFGNGADFKFLEKLSLQNHAFARKIYEAADVPLQLQGFYLEISSPLLSNVTFQYTSSNYTVRDLTQTNFPNFFKGKEIAVAGRLTLKHSNGNSGFQPNALNSVPQQKNLNEMIQILESWDDGTVNANALSSTNKYNLDVSIKGVGRDGVTNLTNPQVLFENGKLAPRVTDFKRLWAYLTVQQLLDADLAGTNKNHPIIAKLLGNETPREKAIQLSLRNSFVTPLTSLVVVESDNKPDAIANSATTEKSSRKTPGQQSKEGYVSENELVVKGDEDYFPHSANTGSSFWDDFEYFSEPFERDNSNAFVDETNQPETESYVFSTNSEGDFNFNDYDTNQLESLFSTHSNELSESDPSNVIVYDTDGAQISANSQEMFQRNPEQTGYDSNNMVDDTNQLGSYDLVSGNTDDQTEYDSNLVDETNQLGSYDLFSGNTDDQTGFDSNTVDETNQLGSYDLVSGNTDDQTEYDSNLVDETNQLGSYDLFSGNTDDQTGFDSNTVDETNQLGSYDLVSGNTDDQTEYDSNTVDETNQLGSYDLVSGNTDDQTGFDSNTVDETNQLGSYDLVSGNTDDQTGFDSNTVDETNQLGSYDLVSGNTDDQTGFDSTSNVDDANQLVSDDIVSENTDDQTGFYSNDVDDTNPLVSYDKVPENTNDQTANDLNLFVEEEEAENQEVYSGYLLNTVDENGDQSNMVVTNQHKDNSEYLAINEQHSEDTSNNLKIDTSQFVDYSHHPTNTQQDYEDTINLGIEEDLTIDSQYATNTMNEEEQSNNVLGEDDYIIQDKESRRSLEDIQWYSKTNPHFVINTIRYTILQDGQTVSETSEGSACTIRPNIPGMCQHLKDCINEDFIADKERFKLDYFCPIKSNFGNSLFVGTCCSVL